jgi:hypothetical protein
VLLLCPDCLCIAACSSNAELQCCNINTAILQCRGGCGAAMACGARGNIAFYCSCTLDHGRAKGSGFSLGPAAGPVFLGGGVEVVDIAAPLTTYSTQNAGRSTQHSVPDSSAASICLVLLLLQLPPLMSSAHPARAALCLSWPPSASLSHLCNTLRIDRSHQGTPGKGSCINATCSRTVRPLLHSFCSGNPRLLTPSQLQLALFPLFPPCSLLPIYFQPQDPS